MTDKLTTTMEVAKLVYTLAHEQNDPAQMLGAYRALAATHFYSGEFEMARDYALRAVQIWHSGLVRSAVEEVVAPTVVCLSMEALSRWHLGEIARAHSTMAEAISVAEKLHDQQASALALYFATFLAHFEGNPDEVERLGSALIELSTLHNFAFWQPGGKALRGWARSVSGRTTEGISWIEDGIEEWRAIGSTLIMPYFFSLKGEALLFAGRPLEALKAIESAIALSQRVDERWWSAELQRLHGIFLTAVGAKEIQIEASFSTAVSIAKQQKSVSLATRAEASFADYRVQKGSA
jgi:predicted ATPase